MLTYKEYLKNVKGFSKKQIKEAVAAPIFTFIDPYCTFEYACYVSAYSINELNKNTKCPLKVTENALRKCMKNNAK